MKKMTKSSTSNLDSQVMKPLSQLCEIITRSSDYYKPNEIVDVHQGAMVISPSNILNNKLVFDEVKYYSWDGFYARPRDIVEIGDILMCKFAAQGSPFKSAVVHDLPEPAMTNPSVLIIKNIKCNPEYLQLVLSSAEFQNNLQRQAKGVMPTISAKILYSLDIPVPPLMEQDRVVKAMRRYQVKHEELISCLNAEIAARQAVFDYYTDKILWGK